MSDKMKRVELVGIAKVKVNEAGEPVWQTWMVGDSEANVSKEPVLLRAEDWPVGTSISMTHPCCPECEQRHELCVLSDCEYDWPINEEYKV